MKKITAIFFVLILLLVGCSTNGGNDASTNDPSNGNGSVEAEDITLTIPASMFEDEDVNDSITEFNEQGITDITINDDGSLTVTMSESEHRDLMAEIRDGIIETFNDMKDSGDFTSIEDIKYNDDFTEISIIVVQEQYEGSFDGFALFA